MLANDKYLIILLPTGIKSYLRLIIIINNSNSYDAIDSTLIHSAHVPSSLPIKKQEKEKDHLHTPLFQPKYEFKNPKSGYPDAHTSRERRRAESLRRTCSTHYTHCIQQLHTQVTDLARGAVTFTIRHRYVSCSFSHDVAIETNTTGSCRDHLSVLLRAEARMSHGYGGTGIA